MRALPAVLLPLLFVIAACSEPPQKEIDRAQEVIAAARAAGAEQYATEAFAAANAALRQSHDAVALRDYRLALTRALDANDRAQEAVSGAAVGKARARSEAERAINATSSALQRFRGKIAGDASRVSRTEADLALRTLRDGESALQEARAALSVGDYLSSKDTVKGLDARITAQMQALDASVASRPARQTRRRR
ncbi:MAG: hypothetical protein ABIP65_11050 [Vicinamibacterales bacterium]